MVRNRAPSRQTPGIPAVLLTHPMAFLQGHELAKLAGLSSGALSTLLILPALLSRGLGWQVGAQRLAS